MSSGVRLALALFVLALAVLPAAVGAQPICIGDCNGDGLIFIDELITGVNIALDRAELSACVDFDANRSGGLEISELIGAVLASVEGCRPPTPTPTPTPLEFVAEAADFECLLSWTRVRHFRITNTLGQLVAALAVANGEQPPPYPVGTIIQLVPNEAMVKRGAGFFPEADDWEFFVLRASKAGTEIKKRGRDEVINVTAPCFACHQAAAQTDLICETVNGCVELNLSEDLINLIQDQDPRCPAAP